MIYSEALDCVNAIRNAGIKTGMVWVTVTGDCLDKITKDDTQQLTLHIDVTGPRGGKEHRSYTSKNACLHALDSMAFKNTTRSRARKRSRAFKHLGH